MKKLIILFLIFSNHFCQAQQIFISKGKIEFEKTMSLHKIMEATLDESESSWWQAMKKNTPTQKKSYFDLYFNCDKTLYKPGREDASEQKTFEWILGPATENIVSTDLLTQTSISQKNVFGNTYSIEDSIRNIKWHLTSDTRIIAGFECRKATGIIMDSVYVFAFYTDQILTSGGPESFTGLPGMILGIAIPRLNTTWFATKLELQEVTPEQLVAAKTKRAKAIDNKTLLTQLTTSMKDWGKQSHAYIWRIML